jgi:hypothetical protein
VRTLLPRLTRPQALTRTYDLGETRAAWLALLNFTLPWPQASCPEGLAAPGLDGALGNAFAVTKVSDAQWNQAPGGAADTR